MCCGDQLKPQVELVDSMDAALTENDLELWADIYTDFHRTLVGQTGMKRLEKLAENLLDQSYRVRIFTLRMRDKPFTVSANQRSLALAIRDGDLEKALGVNEHNAEKRLAEISEIFQKFKLTHL
jgi:DNA-binding GntR family transcriptional regulator